jgi:hypothetical protein
VIYKRRKDFFRGIRVRKEKKKQVEYEGGEVKEVTEQE